MNLKQKFEHRQKLVFSQALTQSVKILELPLAELKETLEAELINNPTLEEIPKESDAANLPSPQTPAEEEGPPAFDKETLPNEFLFYEKQLSNKKESLEDALLRQLRINTDSERTLKIGAEIIRYIDENGYLRIDIPALALSIQENEEETLKTLRLIQTFDPAGVGAGDLKECLLLQLKKKKDNDAFTLRLVENHLEDLAAKNIPQLCKKLKCGADELKNALKTIRHLEPKPGRIYYHEEIAYIIPDAFIEEKDETFNIGLKDSILPVLKINPLYKNMLKSKKVNEETKEFIRSKLAHAHNFIHALQQRRQTLLKVVGVIAEVQQEAIREGLDKLKPLTLKEIAEKAELHESTISRVVMNKYIQTPSGLRRLKDFFSAGIKNEEGEEVASQRLKLKIKELIDNEDKNSPLRDQKIAELVKESEKTPIARRTIAKYRKILKIPPVSQRRGAF